MATAVIKSKGSSRAKVCVFASCTSSSRKLHTGTPVTFIPFAKPCKVFINEEVACIINGKDVRTHKPKSCTQCCKALRWIHLSRRGDDKFKRLTDITKNMFVCSLHFVGDGPTELNPDPMPANVSAREMALRRVRQPPKDRISIVTVTARPKRITKSSTVDITGTLNQPEDDIDESSNSCISFKDLLDSQSPVIPVCISTSDFQCQVPDDNGNLPEETVASLATKYVTRGWAARVNGGNANLIKYDEQSCKCVMEVRITTSAEERLTCSVFVYGLVLPASCNVYVEARKVSNIDQLKDFLWLIEQLNVCNGVTDPDLVQQFHQQKIARGVRCAWSAAVRSKKCKLLCRGQRCSNCLQYEQELQTCHQVPSKDDDKLNKRCNNRFLTKKALEEKAVKCSRMLANATRRCQFLKNKIQKMKRNGIIVRDEENRDFMRLLAKSKSLVTSQNAMSIFLTEQLQAGCRKSCRGYKWNPEIMRWCVYLHKKSPSAYAAIRASKYILLPSQNTLIDYCRSPDEQPEDILEEIVGE